MVGLGADQASPDPDGHNQESELLMVDRQRWKIACAGGLTGQAWDDLLDDIVAFAFRQLRPAIRSGHIFAWCRRSNPLIKLYAPRGWSPEDHEDLVQSTIEKALKRFCQGARRGDGWDPSRGPTLGRYFQGLCVDAFPNCFQSWLREHSRPCHEDIAGAEEMPCPPNADPARIAFDRHMLDRIRNSARFPPRQRKALIALAYGLSHEEIAAQLQISVGAVEGLIRRARKHAERERMEEAE